MRELNKEDFWITVRKAVEWNACSFWRAREAGKFGDRCHRSDYSVVRQVPCREHSQKGPFAREYRRKLERDSCVESVVNVS